MQYDRNGYILSQPLMGYYATWLTCFSGEWRQVQGKDKVDRWQTVRLDRYIDVSFANPAMTCRHSRWDACNGSDEVLFRHNVPIVLSQFLIKLHIVGHLYPPTGMSFPKNRDIWFRPCMSRLTVSVPADVNSASSCGTAGPVPQRKLCILPAFNPRLVLTCDTLGFQYGWVQFSLMVCGSLRTLDPPLHLHEARSTHFSYIELIFRGWFAAESIQSPETTNKETGTTSWST